MRQAIVVLALAAGAGLTGCSPGIDRGTPQPTTTPASAAGVNVNAPEDLPADPPATCALTRPQPAFTPPPRFRATPSPVTQAWYGSAKLWIALDKDGERWHRLPRSADGLLGQKTFWWSELFHVATEQEPAISVDGRRLDRPGATFHAGDPGTNAAFDGMSSMLVGVGVPTPGCWELTGRYRGAELSYVVWITDD
jgi:hypothetical protein